MKDVVLITGANGHLAKVVSKYLDNDYEIRHLTTKKSLHFQNSYFHWDINKLYIDPKALENCNHIIHLAGYPILKKWTKKNKKIIYDSRINSAKLIFETCKAMNVKPKTFISASAIGIYNQCSSKVKIHENSAKGDDWIAQMACDWESAANKFKAIGTRVVQMRISLIFSEKAGFLKYNLLSMRLGVGLIIGDKNRLINWMHAEDISCFIKDAIINKKYNGPYNLACEDKISQEDFFKVIRKNIFPYAIIIKLPISLFSLILGKRSQIIGTDINLDTKKIKEHGFKCKINNLNQIINKINS
jgi:hypothetical protein